MTSPREPVQRPVERVIGSRNRRQQQQSPPRSTNNVLTAVALLAVLALVVAGAALFVSLTKPGPAPSPAAQGSCRTVAWDALPTNDMLPEGWTISGSGFYTDGFGASFAGPAASGAQSAPALNLRVSCYGTDGHLAVTSSHASDLALGGTDVPFSDIGDEVLASQDASGTTTSVYIRRGVLVASIAAGGMSSGDLEETALAIDDAMIEALAVAAASASPGAQATDEEPLPSDGEESIEPEPTEAHAFLALEALLPKIADGNPLSSQSTVGTEAMGGDPSADPLFQWLADNGKKPEDIEYAEAYDPSSTVDVDVIGIRVNGIPAATLRQKLLETWLQATASGITTSNTTIAGKAVVKIDYGDGGSIDYVFERGDAVLILSSADPALVERVLSTLK